MGSEEKGFYFLLLLLLVGSSSGLCPSQCKCDSSLHVECKDANLTVVPIFLNPEIRTLSVEGNKIQKLEGALGFYGSLERLDLSRNDLKHLGQGQFSSQSNLQHLDLSNNFLTSLHAKGGAFKGLKALQTLDLGHNVVSRLDNGTFKGLTSLVELRIRHNLLAEVSPSAFAGLSRLRVLHLENNRLRSLSPSWLSSLSSLRFLHVDDNSISSLPQDAFRQLQALRVVTLSGNELTHEGLENAFRGARAVDTVDLAHNSFEKVPANELAHLQQLSSLDISGNPVVTLDRDSFRDLFLLRTLKVTNMTELTDITGDAFMDNLKLKSLEMEGNSNLNPLPWGVFHFNVALEEISFKRNLWMTLSPHQVPLQSLKNLKLEGLPLHCNCSVLWLWQLYQKGENSSVVLDQVKCASVAASAPTKENSEGETKTEGGEAGDPLAKMAKEQLICQDWSSVLMAVSISILATVLILVIVSAIIYRCRRYVMLKRDTDNFHIKDDTMVYKSTLHPGNNYQQATAASGHPALRQYYGEPAYKAVSAGGYSPTASSTAEPFYEVPKYAAAPTSTQKSPTHSSSEESAIKKRPESNKSSSESSGYVVGSELWESSDLFSTPAHCYLNPAVRGTTTTARAFGSPQSTSTGLSSTGSSSNSSSSTASSSNNRNKFYSPNTMREGGRGGSQWRPHNFSPQLSPPSPAPGGNNSGSRTMLLHQFSDSSSPSPHHFRNANNGGGNKQFKMANMNTNSAETGSLRGGNKGANNSRFRERNFFV